MVGLQIRNGTNKLSFALRRNKVNGKFLNCAEMMFIDLLFVC
jgi:hypothetical protein